MSSWKTRKKQSTKYGPTTFSKKVNGNNFGEQDEVHSLYLQTLRVLVENVQLFSEQSREMHVEVLNESSGVFAEVVGKLIAKSEQEWVNPFKF